MGGGENHFRPKCENPSLFSPFLLSFGRCLFNSGHCFHACVRQARGAKRKNSKNIYIPESRI